MQEEEEEGQVRQGAQARSGILDRALWLRGDHCPLAG